MFGRPRKRLWRWARRVLLTLTTLVILVIGALVVALHNLDRPMLKSRVQSLAERYGGVVIDYRDIHVGVWSGLTIDDLVVRSAPAFRDVAPELAHVKALSVSWDIALLHAAFRLQKVTASGIALTVATNESGAMSFDGLGPPKSNQPSPPETPLSKQPASVLSSALPSVDVTDVSLTMIRPGAERTSLHGVEVHLAPEGTSHVVANIGAPAAPIALDIARERAGVPCGEGHAKLWLTVDATARDVLLALDVEVTKQSLVEHVDVARLVHAEAHAHFDESAHRTSITLEKTDVAAGVATLSAAIELPDQGAVVVKHAEGKIDGPRLLTIMPEGLVPVRLALKRGDVTFRIDSLSTEALPRLNEGANVVIDADLDDVRVTQPVVAAVANGKLAVRVEPDGKGLKALASLTASSVKMPEVASAEGLALDADLSQSETGALAGKAAVAFDALEVSHVKARTAKVGLQLADLVVDPADLLKTRGDVSVTADVASVDAPGAKVDRLAVTAHTALTGAAPYALETTVNAAQLRGPVSTPLHADVKIEGVTPDRATLLRTPAIVHATIDAANAHTVLAATKTADVVDYTLDVKAASLGALRPFVGGPPLETMAATVSSHGTIADLAGNPSLAQHLELRVDNASYEGVSARQVALDADSKGNALRHELHGEIRVAALAAAGTPAGDDRLAFGAALDGDAQTISAHLEGTGRASAKMQAKLGFDHTRRALTYDVDLSAAKLAPLALLAAHLRGLDGFDLSKLEVGLSGKGAVLGVVKAFDRDGVVLEPAPLKTFAVDGTVNVKAQHVAYSAGTTSLSTPAVSLGVVLHPGNGEQRSAETHLEIGEFHLAAGPHVYEFGGIEDRSSLVATGDLRDPELALEQRATVRTVKQDMLPTYPMGDALLSVSAHRTRDGVLHIAKLEVANGAGATQARLAGALDPSQLQKRLSLHGDVRQDLSRLSAVPSRFAARGTANVAVRLESPDLTIFRTVADVKVENASIWLPSRGIVVEDADGEVPITVSVRLTPRGARVIREDQENPYSSLRFADQHPLLRRSSFIKVRRLTLPQVQIAPLVGNLAIEQNLISLQQFEIGVRGGRVTGQFAFDWNGPKSTVSMHVRADSVQSSHGEPFTGNAALFVSAGEHSIEGRADILQIGERHLLDILDLQDPFHADAAMNKVRSALRFGYPDRVRLTFSHGFASAHVQFGGLARFISVGDLKGIPMGPLIDQLVTPFLPAKEEP